MVTGGTQSEKNKVKVGFKCFLPEWRKQGNIFWSFTSLLFTLPSLISPKNTKECWHDIMKEVRCRLLTYEWSLTNHCLTLDLSSTLTGLKYMVMCAPKIISCFIRRESFHTPITFCAIKSKLLLIIQKSSPRWRTGESNEIPRRKSNCEV